MRVGRLGVSIYEREKQMQLDMNPTSCFPIFFYGFCQSGFPARSKRTPENPPRCMCRCPDIFGALRLMYVPVRTFSAPQISSSVCQNPDIFDTQIKVCVGVRTFWHLGSDGLGPKILKSRHGLVQVIPHRMCELYYAKPAHRIRHMHDELLKNNYFLVHSMYSKAGGLNGRHC
jgi:hypothetical protein